jgi:cysteine desulfurase/selenocysteine lyase
MHKQDFPILADSKIVYLDSAASAQKPESVLKSMDDFYRTYYANVHRGQCRIAVQATEQYERARCTVADFIHAMPDTIVFTKGATESINLVASGYERLLQSGDEVLVCIAEHHANFVPWQQACLRSGAVFKVFDVTQGGHIDMADFRAKLTPRTKIVAVAQLGNVLGVENPIKEIVTLAHSVGARVLVDGAQSCAHMPVDVTDLDCDFFAFSGHKVYGPTGIGVLYAKAEALSELPPYQFGGDMIKHVGITQTTFADGPAKFEAGTPPFVEAVGLASALDYIQSIGLDHISKYEEELTSFLCWKLSEISGVTLLGNDCCKKGIVSFNVAGIHPADIAFALTQNNICVRVGHHCAMPIHERFHQTVSLRVSLGLYNDLSDIECFLMSLRKTLSLFGV